MKRLKKFEDFVNENVDSEHLTTELEIEGITDKEIDLINKLKRVAEKSYTESSVDSHTIFFETPIKIGKRSGKDVFL